MSSEPSLDTEDIPSSIKLELNPIKKKVIKAIKECTMIYMYVLSNKKIQKRWWVFVEMNEKNDVPD